MAGDYIAWVKGLTRRREVILMAQSLGISQREVAACCMEWWEWCDSEGDFDPSRDCHVFGVTFVPGLSLIDAHVGVDGFGKAMADVGWASADENGHLMHARLGCWTGSAARERLKENKRKANQRAKQGKMSRKKRDTCPGNDGTKTGTRVEKSRVYKIDRSIDPIDQTDVWERSARRARKQIAPSVGKPRDPIDVGLGLKIAYLVESGELAEDVLADSLEALRQVRKQPENPWAYLCACLRERAGGKRAFAAMLGGVTIPPQYGAVCKAKAR